MFEARTLKTVLAFGVLSLTIVACTESSDETNSATAQSTDLLKYVAADTPYVLKICATLPWLTTACRSLESWR